MILAVRELATLRAALLFWQEEMCPHGAEFVRPYFDCQDVEPLAANEIESLRSLLRPEHISYALFDPASRQLRDQVFSQPNAIVKACAPPLVWVTLILPEV